MGGRHIIKHHLRMQHYMNCIMCKSMARLAIQSVSLLVILSLILDNARCYSSAACDTKNGMGYMDGFWKRNESESRTTILVILCSTFNNLWSNTSRSTVSIRKGSTNNGFKVTWIGNEKGASNAPAYSSQCYQAIQYHKAAFS